VESDPPNPLSVYGRSKLEGEQMVQQTGGAYLILRTAWLYSLRRDSFVTKILNWARERTVLSVVTDQTSSPTWARMLAQTTALLLAGAEGEPQGMLLRNAGIYHLAGGGHASRFEWARQVLAIDPRPGEQRVKSVLPASTRDFPAPARRPSFSALDCTLFERTFGICLPDWRLALKLALA
jgi:dTDP-4-dehydrorhamnose reductase